MRFYYLVVDGYGPQASHMNEVARTLLIDYVNGEGYEVSDCFVAYETDKDSAVADVYLEAYRQMRTCLYGEFQDSEYFEIGFIDVTDELESYENERTELIAVDESEVLKLGVLNGALL